MNQPHTLRLAAWARLIGLALLLGVGLLASLGLTTRTAHAATATITSCDESHLDSAITNAASGDTISFGCDGTITLSSTLTISKNLTLDGNGHSVTLDGGNSVEVLSVNSGVTFTLKALTVAHGSTSGSGGGLFNNGTVTISNSTFTDNSASASGYTTLVGGGGLVNNGGTVTISNSTFAGNSAPGLAGGGLYNYNGTVTISNSTFSGNSANVYGGALYTVYGTISISNSTLSNNSAGGLGGGISLNGGTAAVVGSIVAENHAGDNQGNDCDTAGGAGTINDNGYNLDSDNSCFTAQTSLHTNPELSALANNGGSTQTMALQSNSPAIDRIPVASCPKTDQRGNARPDDAESTCDIGAYESSYPPDADLGLSGLPSDITVNATSAQGASVTYTPPAAVDEDSPLPTVSCDHASGSTFAIGTTTVTCTVNDSDDTPNSISKTFTVTVKDVTAPTLSLPSSPITVNATSPQGASVSYTVTASDPDNAASDLTISCTPASGSTFPFGTTTVNCTATDPSGNSSSGSFQVVVKDVTAPTLGLPGTITVDATSPQGATVSYTVTATDPDNAASQLTISCSPASGSTFAIGTTTVKCSASDPSGNSSSGSFQAVVKGAAAQTSDLVTTVNNFHLSGSLQTALDNKLQDVLTAINAGQKATACSELTDFIGFVQSHTGKGLTTSQATPLIAAAKQVQAVLGC